MPSLLDGALFRSHPVLPSQHHLQKGMFQDMVTKATSKFALWPAMSSIRFVLCMKVAVAGCLGFFVCLVPPAKGGDHLLTSYCHYPGLPAEGRLAPFPDLGPALPSSGPVCRL